MEVISSVIAFAQSNAILLLVGIGLVYLIWSRLARRSSQNSPDTDGLYERDNSKLNAVYESMLSQRQKLQESYSVAAEEFAAQQSVREKQIETNRTENKHKTKSERNAFSHPNKYLPLGGGGGGSSYRPPKKGPIGGGGGG